jgi:hypothetical protein
MEGMPHRDNTAIFRQKIIYGHKFQSGLYTKTYRLTISCNDFGFDFDFESPVSETSCSSNKRRNNGQCPEL